MLHPLAHQPLEASPLTHYISREGPRLLHGAHARHAHVSSLHQLPPTAFEQWQAVAQQLTGLAGLVSGAPEMCITTVRCMWLPLKLQAEGSRADCFGDAWYFLLPLKLNQKRQHGDAGMTQLSTAACQLPAQTCAPCKQSEAPSISHIFPPDAGPGANAAVPGKLQETEGTSRASWWKPQRRHRKMRCQVVSAPPTASKSRGPLADSRTRRKARICFRLEGSPPRAACSRLTVSRLALQGVCNTDGKLGFLGGKSFQIVGLTAWAQGCSWGTKKMQLLLQECVDLVRHEQYDRHWRAVWHICNFHLHSLGA